MRAALRSALASWLALEHEAVWWSGTVGGRFEELTDRARDAYDDHRTERDRLLRLLDGAGPGPQTAYGMVPDSVASARAALADVEDRLCAATVTVVGVAHEDERARALALGALRRAALATLAWGAEPVAFPGLD